MLACRIKPTRSLSVFNNDVDRIFCDFFGQALGTPLAAGPTGSFVPALNIWEDEGSIYVEAEVPGLKLDDLDITLDDKVLTIAGDRKVEERTEKQGVHVVERRYGKFQRAVHLPISIDAAKTEAELKDGILRVVLPKQEGAKSKKIEVKASM